MGRKNPGRTVWALFAGGVLLIVLGPNMAIAAYRAMCHLFPTLRRTQPALHPAHAMGPVLPVCIGLVWIGLALLITAVVIDFRARRHRHKPPIGDSTHNPD
jgi:hypothetical protein